MSQQINLFNPAFEKQKQVLAAATMAQGLLLILVMGAGLAWYGARQVKVLESAAAQSKAQLAEGSDDQKHQYYDKITLELQRSFDHFDRQFHFINVIKLVLAPTGADGLHGYLADNLYMPVEVLDLASVFDFGDVPHLQQAGSQARFFLTLGAALRQEAVAL